MENYSRFIAPERRSVPTPPDMVKDEHDMVNIEFHVDNVFKMITHAKPFVNIEYFVAFGTIYGYVRDEDCKLYVLDGMTAMGEDKDLLF